MQRPRIAFNPNIVVTGNQFFGRESELDDLAKRIIHGQSVLITGERRIGKTSILKKAYDSIKPEDDKSIQIWIDGVNSSIYELGFHIFEALYQRKTIKSLPNLSANDESAIIRKILQALERMTKERARLILFINDLDDMARASRHQESLSSLSSFLRSTLDLGHALACATSFRRLTAAGGENERAPLFNVFNELPLGPFLEREAIYFLSESSKRSGDCLLESECTFFTELVGLVPFHLQVAGYSLFAQDEFIDSVSDRRLEYMINAVEKTIIQLTPHWLYTLNSLTPNQQSILGRIAKRQKIPESADLSYLKQRGFISSGDEPFKSMGSLYLHFLLSVELDSLESDRSERNSYWSFTKDLAQAAIKTLIESGIKTYIK